MLAERYRIVGQLGRGGMGEVYRADDMKLGQPVALKFIPEEFADDPSLLSRFHQEVRIARQVSHPNVCRVYDIGEVDGEHFISMEYVDGEDLRSLLKRIGRVPEEGAVKIARQLCAGLAAAHDKGVLHRDLKPANIMIDGEGRVRITDFGLASLAGQVEGDEIRAGTPHYMAPEQLAGREVSLASDVYALGLVLYELFAGKPRYNAKSLPELQRQQEEPSAPSSVVPEIDPVVEQVILRCLEKEPGNRPRGALAVAAALPGTDPLAAALAAGETPSPELVAESGASGGLKPSIAVLCLVAFLIAVGLLVGLSGQNVLVRRVSLDTPPEVLEARAREVIREAGYENPPADSLYTFLHNEDYIAHLRSLEVAPGRWDVLRKTQPAAVRFAYRQSPRLLVRFSAGSIGTASSGRMGQTSYWLEDPPATFPGMVEVRLDTEGRLLSFSATPPQKEDVGEASVELNWEPLFAAAGFDQEMFTAVDPIWLPPVYADGRAAWEGVYPEAPDISIRVEAAVYRGRPVAFRVIEPWTQEVDTPTLEQETPVRVLWFVVVLVGAGLVALRNIRLGRGDRKTALRFAIYMGGFRLAWMLGAHHVPSADEVELFASHLAWALYRVGLVWVFYLALEPYARKLWPHMLVSWVRLMNGRLRDPLVGRDILIGSLYGAFIAFITHMMWWTPEILGLPRGRLWHDPWPWESLRGLRQAVSAVAGVHTMEVLGAMIGIMMLLVLRLLLRRTWIAVIVFSVLAILMFYSGTSHPAPYLIGMGLSLAAYWLVLFRVGLLPILLGPVVANLFLLPLTYDLTAWYGYVTVLVLFVTLGVAVWGFWVSLAGRPLFRDEIMVAEGGTE
jgi:serine/threonine-protein kinase